MMNDVDMFADGLLAGIKNFLFRLGLPHGIVEQIDPFIYLVFVLIIGWVIQWVAHWILVYFVKKVLKYRKIRILSIFLEKKMLRKITWLLFPLFVITLLPFAIDPASRFLHITDKICWIYFVIVLIDSGNTFLDSLFGSLSDKTELRNRPMKGFMQILQVLVVFIGVIIIISILLDKSPINLITGLGAFAAVLMLIFKDSILGFVSGVLLSQNDMIRIGDWIELDSMGVNGVVFDISLNVVKVQNFDNTTVTVPPYTLISNSFVNWRGMSDSGGRRIMRSYVIDVDNIQFCTPEYLEEMKKIDLISDYITRKQAEQASGKVENTANSSGLVNGTIETNLGLFRAYLTLYLQQHKFVSNDLTLMVRTLEPAANGLPLQVYCFSSNKDWVSYESIQAEIMEHFAAVLPKFGLYPFQNASGRDYINSSLLEAGIKTNQITGVPWGTMRIPSSAIDKTGTEEKNNVLKP